MAKPKDFETDGRVTRVRGHGIYTVTVERAEGSAEVDCVLSGNMKRFGISVQEGDSVRLVLPPPFDRGRITYRNRG